MITIDEVIKQRDALKTERDELAQLLDRSREDVADLRAELEKRDAMLNQLQAQLLTALSSIETWADQAHAASMCIHDLPLSTFCSACGSIRTPKWATSAL